MTKVTKLDPNLAVKEASNTPALRWHDLRRNPVAIRGLPWFAENDGAWLRLPRRAQAAVRGPVWELAHHTAGVRAYFRTDATSLTLRIQLDGLTDFSHMPRTGSAGFALYEGGARCWKPWPVAFPQAGEQSFTRPLIDGLPRKMREFMLYFPLYNGVQSVEIGVPRGSRLLRPTAVPDGKPAVFYGTSITQGGCAHNPGADYAAIVARTLDIDFVNLGFSGNGQGEDAVARLLAEIDAGVYMLDYVANVDLPTLQRTLPRVVRILRQCRPDTPIALVSRPVFSSCHWSATVLKSHEALRDAMIRFYADRRQAGDAAIHFIDGNALIPYAVHGAYSDNGVHPTSVGFAMMAQAMTPSLERIMFPPQADGG